ncbi:hypothetical protein [Croceivirga sp. JEA036]|uniref:hypothetical protein n=1 Tax=Croceivirga sp. JEA036 TaxID=2721162 RepID=UPI00143BF038|nr:hypothetical protein [Croceivirga sp. JEA036]NJB36370.1 hypothetical protein [Croceivirga sp. JEA036]
MELLTTYTVTARSGLFVWQFKYHLNGDLKAFEVLQGQMQENQIKWLFNAKNFPSQEDRMDFWTKDVEMRKFFEVEKGTVDTSFATFWTVYDLKQNKLRAEKLWIKLSEADRIKALAGIRRYNDWLRMHSGIAKCLPDTYLRNKRWEDAE